MRHSSIRSRTANGFSRFLSSCGLLLCGVGCTIAPINCAPPDTNDTPPGDAGSSFDGGVDAGDAGSRGDAGSWIDAGSTVEDAGTSEDAGVTACPSPSSELGSLVLGNGYALAGAVSIPDDVVAVAAWTGTGVDVRVAALRSGDLSVRDLGVWPALGEDTQLFSLVAAEDDVDAPFGSSYLAGNGTSLAAGYTYTGSGSDEPAYPGKIALWDGDAVDYVSAPGNFSAFMHNDVLVINGQGAGDISGSEAIYGVGFENDAPVGKTLATFPSDWNAYSGYSAVTSSGIALLGGFFTLNDITGNHLVAATVDDIDDAWSNNVPFSLADRPVVASGNLLSVAGWGTDVAILRGDWGQPADGIFRAPLANDNGTVTVTGDEIPVLTTVDACTPIHFISTFESDLMVAVGEAGNMRLLRVSHAE